VTRRRDIDRRLQGLGDIREILGAMRNLALLETRKLVRAAANQERVVTSIRGAIAAVLAGLGAPASDADGSDDVLIALGSERGFCGDFNRALVVALTDRPTGESVPIIVIGQRLVARLPASLVPIATLPGATTTEEVSDVLLRLMRALEQWHGSRPDPRPMRPAIVHHRRSGEVATTVLDPLIDIELPANSPHEPPRTYLPTGMLLGKLTEHYLYALLQQIFHGSLMAENERRMLHMETALQRIDERTEDLRRRRNVMRQEEITEEIEVITLSAGQRDR
jgi:F-type H+-transporting ATPase subunit gamma